jgi:hypothetical protein
MRRQLLPLLVAALLGCSKKPAEDSGGGGNSGGVGGDDATAYTLTARPLQKGDKVHVTKSRAGTTTQSLGGKSRTAKEGYRSEYTETVIEKPVDASMPTQTDREYKIAEKTDEKGELKPLSFSGKKVEIRVSPLAGVGYIFIIGGNALQPPDRDDLLSEFQGGEKPNKEGPKKPMMPAVLPNKPVKVGEEWAGDLSLMPAPSGPVTFDKEKSKITAKLVKVYQKEGKQWGQIEADIVQVVASGANGQQVSGTITTKLTIDMVLDGSTPAHFLKLKGQGTITMNQPKGGEFKLEMDLTQDENVTPVK